MLFQLHHHVSNGTMFQAVLQALSLALRSFPVCCIALLMLNPALLYAHNPGLSSMKVHRSSDGIFVVVTMNAADLRSVVPGIPAGVMTFEQFGIFRDSASAWAVGIRTVVDGRECSPQSTEARLVGKSDIVIELVYPSGDDVRIRVPLLEKMALGHRQFLSVSHTDGGVLYEKMLSAKSNDAVFAFPHEASAPSTEHSGTAWDFFTLGIEHIWTGYDHLLFLLALLIVTDNFRQALKIITCFTIAHSITLFLAAMGWLTLSPAIVEPAIAASIVFVGCENLVKSKTSRYRAAITFSFGLIHGLGFAGALEEAGIGHGASVATALLSFNLGVEAGQLAIAALALPMIWRFRRHAPVRTPLVRGVSACVVLAGAYWMIERLLAA